MACFIENFFFTLNHKHKIPRRKNHIKLLIISNDNHLNNEPGLAIFRLQFEMSG